MNSLQSSGQTKPNAVGLSSGTPPCFQIMVAIVATIILLFVPDLSRAGSRYATIICSDPELLKEFNDKLYLGRNLSRMIKRKNLITVGDEVQAKIDLIVEKVEVVLDMFPEKLQFNLVLLPTSRDVSAVYKKNYGKSVNHIAYYSLTQKTIYISVKDTRLKVLAHEIGHMVADNFFQVRPPYTIHELMAQFAEKHVTD